MPFDLVGHRESVDRRHVSFCRVFSKLKLVFPLEKMSFKNLHKSAHQLLEAHFYSAQVDAAREPARLTSVSRYL